MVLAWPHQFDNALPRHGSAGPGRLRTDRPLPGAPTGRRRPGEHTNTAGWPFRYGTILCLRRAAARRSVPALLIANLPAGCLPPAPSKRFGSSPLAGPPVTVGRHDLPMPEVRARYLAEQWCPDCSRSCQRFGASGICPRGEEMITVGELTEDAATSSPSPVADMPIHH